MSERSRAKHTKYDQNKHNTIKTKTRLETATRGKWSYSPSGRNCISSKSVRLRSLLAGVLGVSLSYGVLSGTSITLFPLLEEAVVGPHKGGRGNHKVRSNNILTSHTLLSDMSLKGRPHQTSGPWVTVSEVTTNLKTQTNNQT